MGTLIRKTEPNQKCSSSKPLISGPTAAPAPAKPAQMAMALDRSWGGNTLVMIERVAGMIIAAPTPMTERVAMRCQGSVENTATRAPVAKIDQTQLQHPLAPEAVTEGAERQEQPGEDQGVGVHHPLQLGAGGVELPHDRGEGHVQRGVGGDDEDQAQVHDPEHRPPAVVGRGSVRGRGHIATLL